MQKVQFYDSYFKHVPASVFYALSTGLVDDYLHITQADKGEVINKISKDWDYDVNYWRKRHSARPSVCDKIIELMLPKDHFTFKAWFCKR